MLCLLIREAVKNFKKSHIWDICDGIQRDENIGSKNDRICWHTGVLPLASWCLQRKENISINFIRKAKAFKHTKQILFDLNIMKE